MDREAVRDDGGECCQSGSLSHSVIAGRRKFASGSLLQDFVLSPKKLIGDGDRYISFFTTILHNSIFKKIKCLSFW